MNCLIFRRYAKHRVQQLWDVEDVTSGRRKNHKKPRKRRLQRSEWKNHSDRGGRYGRRCPPLKRVCYPAPTRLASRAFLCIVLVKIFENVIKKQKNNQANNKKNLSLSRTWVLVNYCWALISFLGMNGLSNTRFFCDCGFMRTSGLWGKVLIINWTNNWRLTAASNMKEQLWQLNNQRYFTIVEEIFDILFIQKGPINYKGTVGTCTKLFKANPEQLQQAGVCTARIKIILFCWSCYLCD